MSRLGVWGLVLLVLALLLSGFQILSYRSALKNSAQFIGSFPNNINSLVDLADKASDRFFIVDDYCAYGQFSNPAGHEKYKQSLLDAKKRARIEMHVYDLPTQEAQTASQFDLADPQTAPTVYAALQHNQTFVQYFDYKKQHNDPQPVPQTYKDFLALMSKQQAQCVDELRAAQITLYTDIKQPLPMFMWIRDDSEEAIFSIYNTGHDSRELSQRTKNKQVILLLKDVASKLIQVH